MGPYPSGLDMVKPWHFSLGPNFPGAVCCCRFNPFQRSPNRRGARFGDPAGGAKRWEVWMFITQVLGPEVIVTHMYINNLLLLLRRQRLLLLMIIMIIMMIMMIMMIMIILIITHNNIYIFIHTIYNIHYIHIYMYTLCIYIVLSPETSVIHS